MLEFQIKIFAFLSLENRKGNKYSIEFRDFFIKKMFLDVLNVLIRIKQRDVVVRNSSSVVERGIAGPKVTGSIPVCSSFYYLKKLRLF